MKTLPSATSGTALNRPLDDDPVPASADHTCEPIAESEMAEIVRCDAAGLGPARIVARRRQRHRLRSQSAIDFADPWPVSTAMRCPGSFSSSLAKGFLIDGNPLAQPVRHSASAIVAEAAMRTRCRICLRPGATSTLPLM